MCGRTVPEHKPPVPRQRKSQVPKHQAASAPAQAARAHKPPMPQRKLQVPKHKPPVLQPKCTSCQSAQAGPLTACKECTRLQAVCAAPVPAAAAFGRWQAARLCVITAALAACHQLVFAPRCCFCVGGWVDGWVDLMPVHFCFPSAARSFVVAAGIPRRWETLRLLDNAHAHAAARPRAGRPCRHASALRAPLRVLLLHSPPPTAPAPADNGRTKGFCFVEYLDLRDAEEAIYHLDKSMYGGREIQVRGVRVGRRAWWAVEGTDACTWPGGRAEGRGVVAMGLGRCGKTCRRSGSPPNMHAGYLLAACINLRRIPSLACMPLGPRMGHVARMRLAWHPMFTPSLAAVRPPSTSQPLSTP